jgi:ergothioneine biosynthesis protein EgtB
MQSKAIEVKTAPVLKQLAEEFKTVRKRTMDIVAPLEIEDYVVQTDVFMSPPRWHIGHTSWFFELLLKEYVPGYRVFSEEFLFYFNSYYERFGARINKDRRGTRSRPTVKDTIAYRHRIDERMLELLESSGLDNLARGGESLPMLVRLGLEHEMQHQELLVYDIKHLLADLYRGPAVASLPPRDAVSGMAEIKGGLVVLGYDRSDKGSHEGVVGWGFAFDNEKPAHRVYVEDFALDRTPVTKGEYLEFIESGGYQDYRWWFSDGWAAIGAESWQAPLYWEREGDQWLIRDFHGLNPVAQKSDQPVEHVSFYEASAYAKWKGKRLPTEAEWELAARKDPATESYSRFPWGDAPPGSSNSNLFENGYWGPVPAGSFPEGRTASGCYQMIGDVWEWTTSDYVPYPGFRTEFDEYNDKWFVGQKVLRGGSYATPRSHIRSTYRNFFHPNERWMTSGFRCAKTIE